MCFRSFFHQTDAPRDASLSSTPTPRPSDLTNTPLFTTRSRRRSPFIIRSQKRSGGGLFSPQGRDLICLRLQACRGHCFDPPPPKWRPAGRENRKEARNNNNNNNHLQQERKVNISGVTKTHCSTKAHMCFRSRRNPGQLRPAALSETGNKHTLLLYYYSFILFSACPPLLRSCLQQRLTLNLAP